MDIFGFEINKLRTFNHVATELLLEVHTKDSIRIVSNLVVKKFVAFTLDGSLEQNISYGYFSELE